MSVSSGIKLNALYLPVKPSYMARFPLKIAAHDAVRAAVAAGRLVRQPCEACGSENRVAAHHDDYLEPLTVRWFCFGHHVAWHRANGPGRNGGDDETLFPAMTMRGAPLELTGQRFGRLVAARPLRTIAGRGVQWLCHCDCGALVKRFAAELNSGSTIACKACRSTSYSWKSALRKDALVRMFLAYGSTWSGPALARTEQLIRDDFERAGFRSDPPIAGDDFVCVEPSWWEPDPPAYEREAVRGSTGDNPEFAHERGRYRVKRGHCIECGKRGHKVERCPAVRLANARLRAVLADPLGRLPPDSELPIELPRTGKPSVRRLPRKAA